MGQELLFSYDKIYSWPIFFFFKGLQIGKLALLELDQKCVNDVCYESQHLGPTPDVDLTIRLTGSEFYLPFTISKHLFSFFLFFE